MQYLFEISPFISLVLCPSVGTGYLKGVFCSICKIACFKFVAFIIKAHIDLSEMSDENVTKYLNSENDAVSLKKLFGNEKNNYTKFKIT